MKHYQDSSVEFARKPQLNKISKYPRSNRIVVDLYGGTAEECIQKAREEFGLTEEWEVVEFEGPEV